MKKKKQKGITLVESTIAIGIAMAGVVGVINYMDSTSRTVAQQELIRDLSTEYTEFAKALDGYVRDNANSPTIKTKLTRDILVDEGYLSEVSTKGNENDGVDALGYDIIGRISKPYGFVQSIGVFQEGKVDIEYATKYRIAKDGEMNNSQLKRLYNHVAVNITKLDLGYTNILLSPKNGTSDYTMSRPFSDLKEDLSDYYTVSSLDIPKKDNSFAVFTELQEDPGFLVLRYQYYYPSNNYGGVSESYLNVKQLGYFDFCPDNGLKVPEMKTAEQSNILISNPMPENNDFYSESHFMKIGEHNGYMNVCLPASRAIVDDIERDIAAPVTNIGSSAPLACSDPVRESAGFENIREYSSISASTYKFGTLEYSVVAKGGSMNLACESDGKGKSYISGTIINGPLKNKFNLIENDQYQDIISGIYSDEINL